MIATRPRRRLLHEIRSLVGSGDRIALFTLPFAAVGVVGNIVEPAWFAVGGPPSWLAAISWVLLAAGLVCWAWSVVLILTRVPRGELITTGPYRAVKHPLYTGVALLVLPAAGLLLNSWLGAAIGVVMYIAARLYEPREETALAKEFGPAWDRYAKNVWLPWA